MGAAAITSTCCVPSTVCYGLLGDPKVNCEELRVGSYRKIPSQMQQKAKWDMTNIKNSHK